MTIATALKSSIVRYSIVGGLTAIVEFSLLLIQVELFSINYLVANIIAFVLAHVFNYTLSRIWVFESRGAKRRIEFSLFMLFVGAGLLINQLLLWYLVDQVGIRYEIAKAISILVVIIWNYVTRRYIIFKRQAATYNVD
jgi:putative flippase GtrA